MTGGWTFLSRDIFPILSGLFPAAAIVSKRAATSASLIAHRIVFHDCHYFAQGVRID
jgi:hypothetical protein